MLRRCPSDSLTFTSRRHCAFVFAGATGDLVGVFLEVRTPEPVREFCTEDDLWLLVTGRRTYVEAYADLNMAALGERLK